MKNMKITSALSGISKIFLLVCLAAVLLADLAVIILLAVQGIGSAYITYPVLFAIIDAVFLVQVCISNCRFKYTVLHVTVYCVLAAIFFTAYMAFVIFAKVSVFTDVAAGLWIGVHALAVACVIITYIYAAKRISSGRLFQTVVAVIAAAACVATVGAYGVAVISSGVFGQGGLAVRPLVYEYDEEKDGYRVLSAVNEKGSVISVPAEFNGKKIVSVNAQMLLSDGVTDVYLYCEPTVEFTDFLYRADNIAVHVPKENLDAFKKNFYGVYEYDSSVALSYANATVPMGLEKDEIYVTFSYDNETYETLGRRALPSWIGKKGQSLNQGYLTDIPYYIHSDDFHDGDLKWSYENSGYILSDFTTDGGKLLKGTPVNESLTAAVNIEKVFRVFPGNTNDSKYSLTDNFPFSQIDTVKESCKYTTAKNSDDILRRFIRKGFTVSWEYNDRRVLTGTLESTLNKFSDNVRDITVSPMWELNAPVITAGSDAPDNKVIYGNDITLTVDAVGPTEKSVLTYRWYDPNQLQSSGSSRDYRISNIPYESSGNYKVTVTASSEETSLLSAAEATVPVIVDKRPLNLEWTLPLADDLVYTAQDKTATYRIVGGIINGDGVTLESDEWTVKNAGTYNLEISLQGSDGYKYTCADGQDRRVLTIAKAPITLGFAHTEKYYDGYNVWYNIIINGNLGDDSPEIESGYGAKPDAGTYYIKHTLGRDTVSQNYYIEGNDTATCIIHKQPLDLSWSVEGGNNTDDGGILRGQFVYDGFDHEIKIKAVCTKGELAGSERLLVAEPSIKTVCDAGEYSLNAVIKDKNYEIASGDGYTVKVEKRLISPAQYGLTLTYNGYEQIPSVTAFGVGKDENLLLIFTGTGAMKHAGTHTYTVTKVNNDNYTVNSQIVTYTIKPAKAVVIWSQDNLTYNGKAQMRKPSATGVGGDGALEFNIDCATDATSAGEHILVARIADGNGYGTGDYELENATVTMRINKAKLIVRMDDVTQTGSSQPELSYTVTGFVNGETQHSTGLIVTPVRNGSEITATVNVLDNYDITVVNGRYTVAGGGR